MNKAISLTIVLTFSLVLAACAPAGLLPGSASGGAPANSGGSASSNSSSNSANNGAAAGPSGLQLAAGMLRLEGTSNAVSVQEAAKLLPLWQSLQQIETNASQATPGARPNSAEMQQVGAQLTLIRNAMAPAQIQAITAMNLSRQDIFTAFQQAGISFGGGFRPGGGTFTPPQGTPPAGGNGSGFQGNGGSGQPGGFNGARAGFGGFIPPSVVNGIVQFLQKKSGA